MFCGSSGRNGLNSGGSRPSGLQGHCIPLNRRRCSRTIVPRLTRPWWVEWTTSPLYTRKALGTDRALVFCSETDGIRVGASRTGIVLWLARSCGAVMARSTEHGTSIDGCQGRARKPLRTLNAVRQGALSRCIIVPPLRTWNGSEGSIDGGLWAVVSTGAGDTIADSTHAQVGVVRSRQAGILVPRLRPWRAVEPTRTLDGVRSPRRAVVSHRALLTVS